MFKRIFATAAAASLSVLGATAAAQAQAQSHTRPGQPHGVHVLNLHRAFEAQLRHTKVGKISGIAYAGGHQSEAAGPAASCSEPLCPVTWQGGDVQHTPHVYLVLWGPDWESTETATATYLEDFFTGLGNGGTAGDNWSTIASQYADATGAPSLSGLVYEGAFEDTSTPPANTSLDQIGAEADTFAENQGITDLTDATIIVATQSGTCPQGFVASTCTGGRLPRNDCGYYSYSNEPFINLPYELDATTVCGENSVNPTTGTNDGFSIYAGAMYADTITDPFGDAWFDTATFGGVGDKCGTGFDLTLGGQPYAVPQLWSNAAGGCVPTGAIQDSITITSPGSQSGTVGTPVNLTIAGTSSAGNPLAWSASGLPPNLTINASTGTVTGTPTTAAVYPVTVKAMDEAGATKSVSFNWTINQTAGKPITGDHGKCLDDSGSGTTNGNKVDIWTCNNTNAQQWTFTGGALSVLGKCLDDASQGGSGAKLVIWTCNGHKAQLWTHKSNGEYVLALNGLCLTDPSGSTVNGTQVVLHTCASFADQHWTGP